MKTMYTLLALGLLTLFSGCGVPNPGKAAPVLRLPDPAVSPEVADQRARDFRAATADLPVRGVWLYPKVFEVNFTPEQAVEMIRELGFNRLYCRITSETELNDFFRQLLIAAEGNQLHCEIVMDIFSFYPRHEGNRIISVLRPDSPDLAEMVKRIVKLIDSDRAYATIDGITIVVNPHRFSNKNLDLPKNLNYIWSNDSFGPGLDNDQLMKMSLKVLHDLPEFPANVMLTVAVPDFYNELAKEGKLSCGRFFDFVSCRATPPRLMVIGYGNKPTELVKIVNDELVTPGIPRGAILILTEMAPHTSVDAGRMRRRDWADFLRIISYVRKESEKYPAFGGMVVGPFGILKILQLEP